MDDGLLKYLLQFVTQHKRDIFERNVRQRTRHVTVVLEDIFQPHNASACLRSCDAFGIQDVHIIENRYEFVPNRDIELGSAQWLTLHQHNESDDNTTACLEKLRSAGYHIVATSPHLDGTTLEEYDVTPKTAILFGTEHEGLSETAQQAAEETVRIPTYGFAESLNISVAVAVTLHQLSHRLRTSGVAWQLSDTEMNELRLQWVRESIPNHRLPIIEAEYEKRGSNGLDGDG